MSSPVLPQPSTKPATWQSQLRTRSCVAAAFALSQINPLWLGRVMTAVVRNGNRPTAELVEHHRRMVVAVSMYCAGEGCLPRSIATALLSRSYGYGITWCTGAQDRPFAAHAWVELDGEPIGEVSQLGGFQKLIECTPQYASERGDDS